MLKTILLLYPLAIFLLLIYSFTQLDLSLTFSKIVFLRKIVESFQYIGYFNRELSAFIFVLLMVFLYNFYLIFLFFAKFKQISHSSLWKMIILTSVFLLFSYNAFSHDLFNYIFDAKIVTHYHQNPYLHKALDFPSDPMLSFMHWTHRTYPYGPVWLLLTVPFSFLGLNFFIPTFYLFKLLMTISFIGSVYFISKISQKINPEKQLWNTVFFALNPLVIVESLVSSHLDIVMILFALWSLYALVNKKIILALILLALSIGIKFSTVTLLPFYVFVIWQMHKKKNPNYNIIFLLSLFVMLFLIGYITSLSNFQPWYLLQALFIAAFIANKYYIFIPSLIVSFFALINYLPFLLTGNWDPPIPMLLKTINFSSYIASLVIVLCYFIYKKKLKKIVKKQK